MRGLGSAALGLALASAVTAAQAQTVIERQITNEPVETVVTQGPNGTIVTRRPIAAPPAAAVYPPLSAYPATDGSSTVVETVETMQQPAAVTREVVRPRVTTRTVERVQPRDNNKSTRKVATTQRTVTRQAAPLSLTPDQRRVVYRTIVRERVPNTVVTREIVTPPAPRALPAYPPATVISTDGSGSYGEAVDTYVGTRLGPGTMLYAVPNSVALSVPSTRPYSYAYVDDRVLLVDPMTRMVIEDVTE